ncbi:MAG: cache domain-containing protein, partial [Burkholderiaceae bacterium]|nr:cache domain-containing protein [Burkholderiaceae bacterium]
MVIASLVVGAMLLLSGLLAFQVYQTARQALWTATNDSAQHTSQLISERMRRMVDPADASIRLLAFDPITSATQLPERLRRLPVLARLLAQDPLLSAAYVGYPDGQFLLVRPLRQPAVRQQLGAPPEAAYLVQSIAREPGAAALAGRWSFYDANLRLVSSALRPDYRFDPRTRPWYQEAQAQGGQILTPPYLFFTPHEVGVTLSQPSEDGRAVLGLDVALTDLGRGLGSLRLVPRTEIAVVDRQQRVLAYPDMAQVLVREPGSDTLRLPTLQDVKSPSLQAVQRLGLGPGASRRVEAGGEEWLGLVQPLSSPRWKDLQIVLAIPTRELLADVNAHLERQMALSAALIVLMLGVGWMAGRRLGRSLARLAQQSHALARFDFRRVEHPLSPVREVRELGQVMDRLSDTIEQFLGITHHISADQRPDRMLSSVLYQLVHATRSAGGAVYLVDDKAHDLQRTARYCQEADDQALYPDRLSMAHFLNYADAQHSDADGGRGP